MELLADENVPRPIIERLRADGFTVHAISESAAGASDEAVLSEAQQGEYILITQDQDFGELSILHALPISGAVLLEVARLPLASQADRVALVVSTEATRLAGNFTVIEPFRVRVRRLPPQLPGAPIKTPGG
jgi:predicted nuclease of predicted toxin-antitoxin system